MRLQPLLLGWIALLLAVGLQATLPDTRLAALPRVAALPEDDEELVELGQWLFFDPVLSHNREVACATCHHPDHGWADGRSTPLGVGGVGLGPRRKLAAGSRFEPINRNSPSLLNSAFNGMDILGTYPAPRQPMFWDLRADGYAQQAIGPLQAPAEMLGRQCPPHQALPQLLERLRAIPDYREAMQGQVNMDQVTRALAAFQRSLIAVNSPFDRHLRGEKNAMNQRQIKGMQAFHRAGCSLCHNGPMLSDFKLHNIGLEPALRTAPLRNLALSAPYMHHGGEPSLESVMNFYDRLADRAAETLDGGDENTMPALDPLMQRLDLLPEDHGLIIEFLGALNDPNPPRTRPSAVPSGLPVGGR